MIRLILFDFDGVIANSNHVHVNVTKKALRHAGIKRRISDKEVFHHFGKPYRDVLRALMGDEFSEEKLEKAYQKQQELLHSRWFFTKIKTFPHVVELLKSLKRMKINIAIVTGNDRAFIKRAIKELNMDNIFDLIISADDVIHSKPYPDMAIKAMKLLNIKNSETLLVGDTINDILTAKRANIKSAVVLTGILNRNDAKKLKPDYIFDDVSGIMRIISN